MQRIEYGHAKERMGHGSWLKEAKLRKWPEVPGGPLMVSTLDGITSPRGADM